jgi:riboflavin kinase/FMN adenylyltransferase
VGSVVCIGVFDGVHAGHRALIAEARAEADALDLPLVAVTFDPHPAAVLRPIAAPKSLASMDERVRLLKEAGADEVDILRFDQRMSTESPEEFVDSILVGQFDAKVVVVGANFRFGSGAAGDVSTLRALGDSRGFRVRAVALRSDGEPWSSTRIRSLLMEGQVEAANRILGRTYRLEGIVVHGDHRGRELGYPTANLQPDGTPVIPADGVYAGWLAVGPARYPAAISVGTNPQFEGAEQRVEAFAIDRTGLDLYGHRASVDFTALLRPQEVFDSLEAFITQMGADVDRARELLGPVD